jgi:hypothetical protein
VNAKATQAARSKAARFRKLLRAKKLGARDRAWLEAYDRDRAKKVAPAPPPAVEAEPPPPAVEAEPPPPVEVPNVVPSSEGPSSASSASEASSASAAPGAAPVDVNAPPLPDHLVPIARFDEPAGASSPLPMPSGGARCPCGPDCSGCKGAIGSSICVTTGKRVFPRMSAKEARGFASMVLGAIGAALKYARPDRRWVMPTEAEINELAEALVEILYRHINIAGAVAHFSAAAYVLGKFSVRAFTEPSAAAAVAA